MTLDLIAYQKALNEENISGMLEFIKHSPHKHRFHEYFNDNGDMPFHIVAKKGKAEDLEIIKAAHINAMAAIDRKNKKGQTGLHLACQRGDLSMAQAFIKHKATITIGDNEGTLPIHIAATQNAPEIATLLCEEGANRNKANEKSFLPRLLRETTFDIHAKNRLHQTAYRIARNNNFQALMNVFATRGGQDHFEDAKNCLYRNDIQEFERLIGQYPSILKDQDEKGDSLIHHLIWNESSESKRLLEKMIRLGVDINAVNDEGQTPLHCLAQIGFHRGQGKMLLDCLISLGAKVNQSCQKGLTALHYAARENNIGAIDYLIGKGADFNKVSGDGLTPLHMAAMSNCLEAFKHLVEKYKADIDSLTYPSACSLFASIREKPFELSALSIAVAEKYRAIVEYIVDLKISQNKTSELMSIQLPKGDTLVHYSVLINSVNYYRKLVQIGFNPYVPNAEGLTPLHVAASKGYLELVRVIVDGAQKPGLLKRWFAHTFDIDSVNKEGESSWFLAHDKKHHSVCEFLESRGAKLKERRFSKRIVARLEAENKYASQLEQTTGYQIANTITMAIPTIGSLVAFGPFGAIGTVATQVGLYAAPQLLNTYGPSVYYPPKRFLHNHVHWTAEKAWDMASFLPGYALWMLNARDWYNNPLRRTVGKATSHAAAHASAIVTNNMQVQGTMYALGRQIGFSAVDAYNQYAESMSSPDAMREHSEQQTFQSLVIWGSLLGKEQGEGFINAVRSITDLRDSLFQAVGGFEHTLIDGIANIVKQSLESMDGYQALIKEIESTGDLISSYQSYFTQPQALYAATKSQLKWMLSLRDTALFSIEKALHENLIPDSEYKQYAIMYLVKTKAGLLGHKVQEEEKAEKMAEANLDAAKAVIEKMIEPVVNESEFLQAMRQLEAAKDTLTECRENTQSAKIDYEQCQQQFQDMWDKTPRGSLETAFKNEQNKQFESRLALDDAQARLEHLDKHDPDSEQRVVLVEKLNEVTAQLKSHTEEVLKAQEELLKVLTSFERERFAKGQLQRIEIVDKALSEAKASTTTLLDKLTEFQKTEVKVSEALVSLFNNEIDLKDALQQYNEVEKQLQSIENPGSINLPYVVQTALDIHAPGDGANIAHFIITEMVKTGAISYADAKARMYSTFAGAHDYQLLTHVQHHYGLVFVEVKGNIVQHVNALKAKLDVANANYQQALQTKIQVEKQASDLKNEILPFLSKEGQIEFETNATANQRAVDNQLWQATHQSDFVNQVVGLVGDASQTLKIAQDLNKPYSPHLKNTYTNQTLAKWLISYKYTFMKEPAMDQLLVEIKALSTKFGNSLLTESELSQAKADIDKEIASAIYQSSIQSATSGTLAEPSDVSKAFVNNVQVQLQNALGTSGENQPQALKIGDSNLSEMLEKSLQKSDAIEAKSNIEMFLHLNGKTVSYEEFHDWQPTPAPVATSLPEVEERRGLSKLWHNPGQFLKDFVRHPLNEANDVADSIMKPLKISNVSVVANTNGKVQLVLPNQQTVDLYDFNKPKQILFEIYKSPLTQDPVHNPKPVGTALSSKPLPTVFPNAPWIAKPPTPGLLPPEQFRMVPLPPTQSSAPVLPLNTYLPSLAGQKQSSQPISVTIGSARAQKRPPPVVEVKPIASAPMRLRSMDKVVSPIFEFDLSPPIKVFPFGDGSKKSFDIFNPKNKGYITSVSAHLESKQVPLSKPTIEKAVSWSGLFFKALSGDRSPDVLRWQNENASKIPKPSDAMFVLEGFKDAAFETLKFSSDEYNRFVDGEETVIGTTITQVKEVVFKELSGQTTLAANAVKSGWEYASEDVRRFSEGSKTQIEQHAQTLLSSLAGTPKEQLLRSGGKELFYLMLGEGLLRGVGYAAKTVPGTLTDKLISLEKMGAEFFSEYSVRSPITFSFEQGRLNASIPVDLIFLRNPLLLNDKDFAQALARPVANGLDLAANVASKPRLEAYLALQQSNILTAEGKLTDYAIKNAENAIGKRNPVLGNSDVKKELLKNGGQITDWNKFKTPTIKLTTGQEVEVHFYKNITTNEVNYNIDFKVKEVVYSGKTYDPKEVSRNKDVLKKAIKAK